MKTEMTDKRVKEIALALVKYAAARREVVINPHDDETSWAQRLGKKIGISDEKAKDYFLRVTFPVALRKHFGEDVKVVPTVSNLSEDEIGAISLAIIWEEGMDISPNNFQSRIERVEKRDWDS